jgi:hypothetical protein
MPQLLRSGFMENRRWGPPLKHELVFAVATEFHPMHIILPTVRVANKAEFVCATRKDWCAAVYRASLFRSASSTNSRV